MSHNIDFRHKEFKFLKISRTRLFVGLILGISYAFIFYSFLYLIREILRMFSVTKIYDLWILSDNEVNFCNLFFAFISVIIAQSMCFTFWIERPKRIFDKFNYKKTTIINDQRVLNYSFLSWFSRISFVIAIMFLFTYPGGYYIFKLYPDSNYIFILIIIVLFFQTWNAISLTFKRKSFKWLLVSMIIVSILSFGLSKINLIDYKAINKIILKKNVFNNYTLHLPESNTYKFPTKLSLIETIYIAEAKNGTFNSGPIIIADNKVIELYDLHKKIHEWQLGRNKYDVKKMLIILYMHKTTKMSFVNKLKNELSKAGVSKIGYAVIPIHREFDERVYQSSLLKMNLPNPNFKLFNSEVVFKKFIKSKNTIEIKQEIAGYCIINNTKVESSKLKLKLKKLINKRRETFIVLYINDNQNVSEYLNIYVSIKEAFREVKNEYALKTYSKEFDWLSYEKSEEINKIFKLKLMQMTTEMIETLKNE